PVARCRSMPPVFRLWKPETSLILRSSPSVAIHIASRDATHYTMPRCSVGPSPISRRAAMPSPAFYATDFKVFDEPGFRARMGAIRERIRPKLEAVGHSLAPAVRRATRRPQPRAARRAGQRADTPPGRPARARPRGAGRAGVALDGGAVPGRRPRDLSRARSPLPLEVSGGAPRAVVFDMDGVLVD